VLGDDEQPDVAVVTNWPSNSPAPGTRACGGGSLVTEEVCPSVLEPIASFTAVTHDALRMWIAAQREKLAATAPQLEDDA
jgi:hypothetical protein